MFNRMLQFIGLRPAKAKEPVKPKEPSGEIISEGDPKHPHKFEEAQWNDARLGPSVVDFDRDYGTVLEFPMVTLKYLSRCSCGREIVTSVRALI